MPNYLAEHSARLDKFLADMMPNHSRTQIAAWIKEGKAVVDGVERKGSFVVEPGMNVHVEEIEPAAPHDLTPSDIEIPIVYEDSDLLVVNKPRGMATHPSPGHREATLVNALLGSSTELSTGAKEYRPGIVHRLDKETTGLLIVAKNDLAHWNLADQIAKKTAERRYVALIEGKLPQPRLKIDAPIARDPRDRRKMAIDAKGKSAVTHIQVLRELGQRSLIAARLETGRTHQIRVHLSAAGCPVIGDTIYAKGRIADGPLQLHAAYLQFKQPRTGETITLSLDPPQDFEVWDSSLMARVEQWPS